MGNIAGIVESLVDIASIYVAIFLCLSVSSYKKKNWVIIICMGVLFIIYEVVGVRVLVDFVWCGRISSREFMVKYCIIGIFERLLIFGYLFAVGRKSYPKRLSISIIVLGIFDVLLYIMRSWYRILDIYNSWTSFEILDRGILDRGIHLFILLLLMVVCNRQYRVNKTNVHTKAIIVCPNCGNAVSGNNIFCTKCGTPLKNENGG